jgi:hypothetical protein
VGLNGVPFRQIGTPIGTRRCTCTYLRLARGSGVALVFATRHRAAVNWSGPRAEGIDAALHLGQLEVVVDDLLEELVSSRELLQGLRDRSRVLDTARACRFATPARW